MLFNVTHSLIHCYRHQEGRYDRETERDHQEKVARFQPAIFFLVPVPTANIVLAMEESWKHQIEELHEDHLRQLRREHQAHFSETLALSRLES